MIRPGNSRLSMIAFSVSLVLSGACVLVLLMDTLGVVSLSPQVGAALALATTVSLVAYRVLRRL